MGDEFSHKACAHCVVELAKHTVSGMQAFDLAQRNGVVVDVSSVTWSNGVKAQTLPSEHEGGVLLTVEDSPGSHTR